MVSSIGSSSYSNYAFSRPDPAQMAGKLFSKLDTKGQGYLSETDLQSAFNQMFTAATGSSATSTSSAATSGTDSEASQLFKTLDSDGNGQVTKSEFTSGLQKLADALDSQAASSRMGQAQGAGGMPPPPPPQGDGDGDGDDGVSGAGFTKDQLTSQLQQIGDTDSQRSGLISKIVANFDKADTNGDGKVSAQEAMAYDRSTRSDGSATTSTNGTSDSASSATGQLSDARLMHRVMELMRAYGVNGDTSGSATTAAGGITAVSA